MKKKKGQALMEVALTLPIVLMLFCGMIDFGRILYTVSRLNLVAQESVRLAGLGKGDSEVIQYALDNVDSNQKSTLQVSFNPQLTSTELRRKSGDYVTVIISCDVPYITPFVGRILNSPFKAQTQSTIRVE